MIYAPEAGGSGIDNLFINAKWLVKLSGTYLLPADINVAVSYNARQGYPFPQAIRTPNRAYTGSQADVLLDPLASFPAETKTPAEKSAGVFFEGRLGATRSPYRSRLRATSQSVRVTSDAHR